MWMLEWLRFWVLLSCVVALSINPLQSDDSSPPMDASDPVCNPGGTQEWYTGIRAYSTTIYGWPVRHNWYLARCEGGNIVAEQYFQADSTANFPFGEPMCFEANDCVIIGRRKKFAERQVIIYRPYTTLGAIFAYNSTSQGSFPISTIVSDVMAHTLMVSRDIGPIMRLVPLFFTPQRFFGFRGASARSAVQALKVDPYEKYIYTDDDREQLWHYANVAVNDLWYVTSYLDKVAFWEFDGLQRQISGGHDWRRVVNKAIPDTHKLSNRIHEKLRHGLVNITTARLINDTYKT